MKYRMMDVINFDGCLICNVIKMYEKVYFTWFFMENYHDISTLESMAKHPLLMRYSCKPPQKTER